jgi:hypothetical protein
MRRSNSIAVTASKEDDMTDAGMPPVTGLNWKRVGEVLTKLPTAAAYLRHASLQGTLEYVWDTPGGREAEFVRDILSKPLDDVLDK